MPVTPSGMLSVPDALLRTMLSNCPAFRTWTGTANPTAALARIHLIVKPAAAARPFALIDFGGEFNAQRNAGGSQHYFQHSGSLLLLFEDDVDSANAADGKDADAEYEFRNNLGAVLSELEDLAGRDDNLTISRMTVLVSPARTHVDERATLGDYYQTILEVTWGP